MYSVWPSVSLRVRVSLGIGFRVRVSLGIGFSVRVRVKVRVSFRLATFMYSVWPPVPLRVRISLGLELRSGSVLDSPLSCILYGLLYPTVLTPNPKNFTVPF